MPNTSTDVSGISIRGSYSEFGLPIWRMPSGIAIEMNSGCRLISGRHGIFLYYPHDFYLGKAMEIYGECCELELMLYREVLREGGVIVEVGANAGYLTVPLARMVGPRGRVIAIEPQPAIYRLLCANVALNGLPWVSCIHAAVGARQGSISVPDIDPCQPGNLGATSLADQEERGGYRVDLVTLTQLAERIDRLDVMKIDVEGMERDVLAGGHEIINRFRPWIVAENDRPDRSRDLIEYLFDLGYCCYWHIQPLFNPGNFFRQTANLYPQTSSFNMLCVPAERPQPTGMRRIEDAGQHPLRS